MATWYLAANSHAAALANSEDWWNKVLQRPKLPQDITQFLCAVISNPVKPSQNYVVVRDEDYAMVQPFLTTQQQNFYMANRVDESDPGVQECLAAIAAQAPQMPP